MYRCINCLCRLLSRFVNCRGYVWDLVVLLKRQDELANDLKCVHGRFINELIKILTECIDISFLTLSKKEHQNSKNLKLKQTQETSFSACLFIFYFLFERTYLVNNRNKTQASHENR